MSREKLLLGPQLVPFTLLVTLRQIQGGLARRKSAGSPSSQTLSMQLRQVTLAERSSVGTSGITVPVGKAVTVLFPTARSCERKNLKRKEWERATKQATRLTLPKEEVSQKEKAKARKEKPNRSQILRKAPQEGRRTNHVLSGQSMAHARKEMRATCLMHW